MRATQHASDEDCTLDARNVCAVCGVWHGDPCPDCGGRGYHRQTCGVMPMRATRFQIDALEGRTFDGFTLGMTWNGFACPLFTYEQAQEVLGAFVRAGDKGAHYDAERDEFVFRGAEETWDEPERFGAVRIRGTAFYGIGAAAWIWTEEGQFGS